MATPPEIWAQTPDSATVKTPGTQGDSGLAQELQNPIFSFISVPFQSNQDYGISDELSSFFFSPATPGKLGLI